MILCTDDDVGTPCAIKLPCNANEKPSLLSSFITHIIRHSLIVFTLKRKRSDQLNLSNYHVELTHTTHTCPIKHSLCKRLWSPHSTTFLQASFFRFHAFFFLDFLKIFYLDVFLSALPINAIIHSHAFKSH